MNPFKISLYEHKEYICDFIKQYGFWEPITTEVLMELIRGAKPGTRFVDVGANIGWFSLVSASTGMKTVAFEPVESNFRLFESSITVNKFDDLITLFTVAVGEKEGYIDLNISRNNMGMCSTRQLSPIDYDRTETVEMWRLDDFFIDNEDPLIVKIDVEEAELGVLKGMEGMFKSGLITHIIMEVSRYQQELFEILKKHGFNYSINIGYDPEREKKQILETHYLDSGKYDQPIEVTEHEMKNIEGDNHQRIILFYKK